MKNQCCARCCKNLKIAQSIHVTRSGRQVRPVNREGHNQVTLGGSSTYLEGDVDVPKQGLRVGGGDIAVVGDSYVRGPVYVP